MGLVTKYSVTHKGWDYKDDVKLTSNLLAYKMIWQRKKQVYSCREFEYKETASIKSVQSSLNVLYVEFEHLYPI